MPGGITARIQLTEATHCAIARSRFTSGWKYTLMTLTPYIVWLSIFLMPVMLLESEYSE